MWAASIAASAASTHEDPVGQHRHRCDEHNKQRSPQQPSGHNYRPVSAEQAAQHPLSEPDTQPERQHQPLVQPASFGSTGRGCSSSQVPSRRSLPGNTSPMFNLPDLSPLAAVAVGHGCMCVGAA